MPAEGAARVPSETEIEGMSVMADPGPANEPSPAEVLDARIRARVDEAVEDARAEIVAEVSEALANFGTEMTNYVEGQVMYLAGMVAGAKISSSDPKGTNGPKPKPKP